MRGKIILGAALIATAALAQSYDLKFMDARKRVAPRVTEAEFMGSDEGARAAVKGRLIAHANGVLLFEGGRRWFDKRPDGSPNPTITAPWQSGRPARCLKTGDVFPTGRLRWCCEILRGDGVIVSSDAGATGETFPGDCPKEARP